MTLPILYRSFIPTMVRRWRDQTRFIVKHRATLTLFIGVVDPASAAAVNAAMDALVAALPLMDALLAAYEAAES
jgi:hypothetical protein